MDSDKTGFGRKAIVIGSSGGIGAALANRLRASGYQVTGLARTCTAISIDIQDEASIVAAAGSLSAGAPYHVVLVATGLLHGDGISPEKSFRELRAEPLLRYFAVNTVGPALVARHFLPLLPKTGRSVFAALSARVGSISDNRLGGWYGYRSSKAALNMMIRNLAIELRRTRPDAICVALHPGTVDTRLSKPFQRSVSPERLFTPEHSAACLLETVERLKPDDSGGCFAWDGTAIPA